MVRSAVISRASHPLRPSTDGLRARELEDLTRSALSGAVRVRQREVQDTVRRQQHGADGRQDVDDRHERDEVDKVVELLGANGPLGDVAGVVQWGEPKVPEILGFQLGAPPAREAQHIFCGNQWAEGCREQLIVNLSTKTAAIRIKP